MPLKSIVQIEVDDSNWKDFKAAFDKYQTTLKQTAGSWQGVTTEINKQKSAFLDVSAAMVAAVGAGRALGDSIHLASTMAGSAATGFASMVKASAQISKNVAKTGIDLLKWGGILGGLAGVGSLLGLDALANSVSQQRTSSLRAGTSYGGQAAFSLDFGRYFGGPGGAQNVLSNVSQGIYDVTSPQYQALVGLGFTAQQIQGSDPTTLAAQAADRFRSRYRQQYLSGNTGLIGPNIDAYKFSSLGLDLNAARAVEGVSNKEWQQQQSSLTNDTSALGLTGAQQLDWQNLQTQLDRAGQEIENVLVVGLTNLTDPLDKLSGAVVDVLKAFLDNKQIGSDIDNFAKALEQFAGYVGSKQFLDNVSLLATSVGLLAQKMADALKQLGWVPAAVSHVGDAASFVGGAIGGVGDIFSGAATLGHDIAGGAENAGHILSGLFGISPAAAATISGAAGTPLAPGRIAVTGNPMRASSPSVAAHIASIRAIAVANGVNPDFAVWLAQNEGLNNMGSHWDVNGLSEGAFQLHNNPQGTGLGDQYQKYTGYKLGDPKHQADEDTFAIQHMKTMQQLIQNWGTTMGKGGFPAPYAGQGVQPTITLHNQTSSDVNITGTQVGYA